MEKISMSASEVVKRIRSGLNFSQAELGEKLSVSKTAIYKWEKGIVVPTHLYVKKLVGLAKEHKIKVKLEEFYND